jgi:hypothetical protein
MPFCSSRNVRFQLEICEIRYNQFEQPILIRNESPYKSPRIGHNDTHSKTKQPTHNTFARNMPFLSTTISFVVASTNSAYIGIFDDNKRALRGATYRFVVSGKRFVRDFEMYFEKRAV